MSDVKRLLDEATPLPWRQSGTKTKPHWFISGPDCLVHGPAMVAADHVPETLARWTADAALIVHAVNRLPDYEAAVDALELVIGEMECIEGIDDLPHAVLMIDNARAVLRRLRGDVAARPAERVLA